MKFSQRFLPQTNCVMVKISAQQFRVRGKVGSVGRGNKEKKINKFAEKLQDGAWGIEAVE